MKMLAGILVNPGVIELHEREIPRPSSGELLIRIEAALTCGTDLKAFMRGHPVIPMPGPFGHEFSGTVAAVGKGVKRFREGDEIMAVHSAPCRACEACATKRYNLCDRIMRTKVLGAFAEYLILPAAVVAMNTFEKPRTLSFRDAAFLEPLSCVVHGMDSISAKSGERALVIGAGPIGLLHLLLMKRRGMEVTVMDKQEMKLKLARSLGADRVIPVSGGPPHFRGAGVSPQERESAEAIVSDRQSACGRTHPTRCRTDAFSISSLFETVGRITNGRGFDYVFECTGSPEVWESSVHFARRGGTVILFGGCKAGTNVSYSTDRLHYDEIALKGVFHFTPTDVKKAYKVLSEGTVPVGRLISGEFPLHRIRDAFALLSRGEGIKYAIIP